MGLGSTIGSVTPWLFGDHDLLSAWPIIGGLVGGIVGIWLGVKLSKMLS